MTALLPTVQAREVRSSLITFLTTTFALTDAEAQDALARFLGDPRDGIFKGPYARLRLPFRAADEGWREALEWAPGEFPPYGHQAEAYRRLSSLDLGPQKPRPLPTLVTTGTGSGKTESFLVPILDHVQRQKARGETGIKALILYPMNALANDQAGRLRDLILQNPQLTGIRAALYTGQAGPKRSVVDADGLINKKSAIRADVPDILLTNYKMLDQLLLRTADQPLWQQSASSLRYLVLDEFHSYDGAQGTDVAMLLRRLGLALKRNWPSEHPLIDDAARSRPLGLMTPVATSATLGDKGDPAQMIEFAHTVFGETFDKTMVVTETRLDIEEWSGASVDRAQADGRRARPLDPTGIAELAAALEGLGDLDGDAHRLTLTIVRALWGDVADDAQPAQLLDLLRAHPLIHDLVTASDQATELVALAHAVFGTSFDPTTSVSRQGEERELVLTAIIAALGYVRAAVGREAASVDVHLWMRSLTRVDRVAGASADFRWTEQVAAETFDNADPYSSEDRPQFPAIYCRHCGRSGWGVQLAPTGSDLAPDDADIRGGHLAKKGGFRALIFAPQEADRALGVGAGGAVDEIAGLQWFSVRGRRLSVAAPSEDDPDVAGGWILPVLTVTGDDVESASRDDTCPSCERVDGIRFLGSAIATMLSVAVTSLFGDAALDLGDKKALVFTDSVQDAAHRAGFVQSRAHVFGFRNAIRRAVGTTPTTLDALVETMMQQAVTPLERYRLLAPDIADREQFQDFWKGAAAPATRTKIKDRLLLDVGLEFGLQSGVGRTLERTGALAVQVEAGSASRLENLGRDLLDGFTRAVPLEEEAPAAVPGEHILQWVRGVLERMRDRGAIDHKWLKNYIENDGKRWFIWGGRPRGVGMPAFPQGRDAPGFPRIGPAAPTGRDSQKSHLDIASSAQSWFATWARKTLGVSASDGAKLTRLLFERLESESIVTSVKLGNSAIVYKLSPDSISVAPIDLADLADRRHQLDCDTCSAPIHGTAEVIDQLDGAPCTSARCSGRLRRAAGADNYYRRLYTEGDMRRVVAREHTSLLDDKVRLDFETRFKNSSDTPDAPNVLVATPTLEMGIDIGDLSTVMLAGLPRTVASYLQRVGRAGRRTGNALSMAFVTGSGEQLPKIGDPLSVINGKVRAPATYLDAEQILHRQYTAFLIDRRAALLDSPPTSARDVLKTSEGTSFLGALIADAETRHAERLGEFAATFNSLSDWAMKSLAAFGTPGDGAASSPLAAAARTAVADWRHERDLLRYRREAIEIALPELEAAAEHAAATPEAKDELRAARTSRKLIGKLLSRLDKEYWIGALERFGLLPNYTLLDDSVRLDVSLSWIDPDTQDYSSAAITYDRSAGVAIGELAPGAKFYAQGIEIAVDAVDLGRDGDAVEEWVLCPDCGYSRRVDDGVLTTCPRCGTPKIADAGQRMRIVELQHVSAEVRRDEATITDRHDERERVRFVLQPIADIDPGKVADQWYVESTGFGVKYLRDVPIRWLNLGRLASGGTSRFIAGQEISSPLFRVCEACGKLDSTAGANRQSEHRSWCIHRKSASEHVTTIALSRTLRTQGVVLRLPGFLTRGDSLAMPSLAAAVRLGLRETIGGDPDHLRMLTIVDPELTDGGDNHDALLIHDAVPGGSGYLADLANPDRIREILLRAWEVVENCACKAEGRAACHLCLLPFIDGGDAGRLSRASAAHSLRVLLGVTADGEAPKWETTTVPPAPAQESAPEAWFRELFVTRAKTIGTVKEIPGESGSKVLVTLGQNGTQWMLRPQVMLGFTQPDFVLERFGGNAESVAIYTDGYQFHASSQHNNIRSDADKRRALRNEGYRVIGVTWADLQRAAERHNDVDTSAWYGVNTAQPFAQALQMSLTMLESVRLDPITRLMQWMQNPRESAERWGRVARHLPLLTRAHASAQLIPPSTESLRAQLAGGLDVAGTAMQSNTWVNRVGGCVMIARTASSGGTEALVALNDSAESTEGAENRGAWQAWLQMSNVLAFADFAETTPVMATSELNEQATALEADASTAATLPDEWQALFSELTSSEAAFAEQMASLARIPVPEVGREIGDGIPVSFLWEDHRVLAAELDERDYTELTEAGWVVVPLNLDKLRAALNLTEVG